MGSLVGGFLKRVCRGAFACDGNNFLNWDALCNLLFSLSDSHTPGKLIGLDGERSLTKTCSGPADVRQECS